MSLAALELRTADEVRAHARVIQARQRAALEPQGNSEIYVRQLREAQKQLEANRSEIDGLKTENNILRVKLVEATGQRPEASRIPTIKEIQHAVCKYFGVAYADLLARRRKVDEVHYRQIGMYLAKILTVQSLPEIGRRFGKRDHTTVIHAIQKMERLRKESLEVDASITALQAIILSGGAQ